MKPWLHQTAGQFEGKVKFVAVDHDKSLDVVKEYNVEGMPTFVLMKGTEEVGRVVGASQDEILSMIKEAL